MEGGWVKEEKLAGEGKKGGRKGGGFNQVLVVEGRSSEWRSSEK